MRDLYEAYQLADSSTRQAFSSAAEKILNVGKDDGRLPS